VCEAIHNITQNYEKLAMVAYHNKQIWPNKLIKLKLSSHDNIQFVWLKFREINVLKSVNKLYFGRNYKRWANLVFYI